MNKIDKTKPVMITGATGYVAGPIVKKFLEEGFTVHAPIRSPGNKEKTKYLDSIASTSAGQIKYFKADLLDYGSYNESMNGCQIVLHIASPFTNSVEDVQKELIEPALEGTRNVLNGCNQTPSVKRVVITSSCAAIYGDVIDLKDYPNQMLTEAQWNETSSARHQPYSYSKVLAERDAWKIAGEQNQWDLVVINPSFVIGPGIGINTSSESYNLIKQLGDGQMKMGTIDMQIGAVDVRDLAEAHYQAAIRPEASGRHIVSNKTITFLELADLLRPKYGDTYPLPTRNLPKFMVWLMAPLSGFSRKFVSCNIGYPWQADNSKSKKELGVKYRPMKETINDFFGQMVENGTFEK